MAMGVSSTFHCTGAQMGLLEEKLKLEREMRMRTGVELNKDRPKRVEHSGMLLQSQTLEAEAVGGLQVAGQFRQQLFCFQK